MSNIRHLYRLSHVMRTIVIGALCWTMSSAFALEIGVVDMSTITQSSKMKVLLAQLQSKAETYQEKLETLKKEFDSLKNEFDKNEMLMDEAARQSKQLQLQKKAKALETAGETYSKSIMQENKSVNAKLQGIIEQYAHAKKIDILLSPNGVIYANPKLDKTQDIVKFLKKSNLN